MYEMIVTGIVLVLVIFAIVTHVVPSIVIGLVIPLVLTIFDVIPVAQAFTPLTNTTTFLIVGALVLGDACFRVGITDWIGEHVIRYTQRFRNESVKLLIISVIAATMSAFLSSAGVQVALMTLILVMSQVLKISRSRALISLGYASGLGGTWSIVGTTLMVMAKSAYETARPGETIGMFEMTRLTLPVGLALLVLYCFVTSRYQKDRSVDDIPAAGTAEKKELNVRDCLIVGLTFLGFIILLVLDGKTPIPATMVTVLVLLVLGGTKVMSVKDMTDAIDWGLILFISGITVLSNALSGSLLGDMVGKILLSVAGGAANHYVVIGAICVVCGVLTQLISNAGAFGIVLPFLQIISDSMGMELKPLLIAACMICSCGFCLPLATPTFMMLSQKGNITTGDWMKQGVPLLVVAMVLTTLLVPRFWPL